jgi:uncharacterized protein (DUF983 family)
MIALIILNLVLAFIGASASRLPFLFTSAKANDTQALLSGVIGTLLINIVLWLGYTTNATFLMVLSVTFPSFILGTGLAMLWNRRVRKSGN